MKIDEICKIYGISKQTWYNWKKEKPELIEAIKEHIKKKSGAITINGGNIGAVIGDNNHIMINGNDVCKEICEALNKLDKTKQKKFYHKFMAELLEEIEKGDKNEKNNK
jgi:hypothetical protein